MLVSFVALILSCCCLGFWFVRVDSRQQNQKRQQQQHQDQKQLEALIDKQQNDDQCPTINNHQPHESNNH